jgi:dinuclear metal center YbgI/SA1388 family protein
MTTGTTTPTVADVSAWLESIAPPHRAEAWDNVGLLWGDPGSELRRVMTCLTVTPATAREAIDAQADLIVSHHPVLFRGAKKIVRRATDPDGMMWDLARAGIAVASPHTAYDNAPGGINDQLAARMGLIDVGPLRPEPAPPSFKVVVFTPEPDRPRVLDAAFAAGAGRIGAYRECSFGTPGTGTFFGEESSSPAVGAKGRREQVDEIRIELICPGPRLSHVLAAIRGSHSYEEPAIDVYPLHVGRGGPGVGRIGTLAAPTPLATLADRVRGALGAESLSYAGDPELPVRRLAIACGAGDDFLADAAAFGAQALLTGEARYHRAVEAERLGIGLIAAGHHATERIGVEALADLIRRDFPDVEAWASRSEHDPWRSIA